MPVQQKYIGFHALYFIPVEDLEACTREVSRLAIRLKCGDTINPLEMLAIGLLQVNGLLGESVEVSKNDDVG